jgi:maltose alpha-D-glucosyltransferase/alpha-amylase
MIASQGDGWSYTLAALNEYYRKAEKRHAQGEKAPLTPRPLMETFQEEPPATFVAMAGDFLQAVRTLGRRTAEFHLALSAEKKNKDFLPEPATAAFTTQYAEAISRLGNEALTALTQKITDLSPALRETADRILIEGPNLLDRVQGFAAIGKNLGFLIRCHGDYHLGQVLRTENDDFILLDFEGEPIRPLAERRRKNSPLKDVAGMVRSFHYAACTVCQSTTDDGNEKLSLPSWRLNWQHWVSAAFIAAYLEAAAGAPFLPTSDLAFIMEVFLLEKVFYELKYELNNRPDWVHIPLAAFLDILQRNRK